jgi:hypothetical protein
VGRKLESRNVKNCVDRLPPTLSFLWEGWGYNKKLPINSFVVFLFRLHSTPKMFKYVWAMRESDDKGQNSDIWVKVR